MTVTTPTTPTTPTTLQELLASSLERLGAAGLAGREDKTTAATGFWNMRKCKHDCIFHNPRDVARLETRIVVWAAADGTLFPSAEERDAHDGITQKHVKTNEEHFGHKTSPCGEPSNASALACDKECYGKYLQCEHCRLQRTYSGALLGHSYCYEAWDKAPYGMPLDKRTPWGV